jgi:hypothetical protein
MAGGVAAWQRPLQRLDCSWPWAQSPERSTAPCEGHPERVATLPLHLPPWCRESGRGRCQTTAQTQATAAPQPTRLQRRQRSLAPVPVLLHGQAELADEGPYPRSCTRAKQQPSPTPSRPLDPVHSRPHRRPASRHPCRAPCCRLPHATSPQFRRLVSPVRSGLRRLQPAQRLDRPRPPPPGHWRAFMRQMAQRERHGGRGDSPTRLQAPPDRLQAPPDRLQAPPDRLQAPPDRLLPHDTGRRTGHQHSRSHP